MSGCYGCFYAGPSGWCPAHSKPVSEVEFPCSKYMAKMRQGTLGEASNGSWQDMLHEYLETRRAELYRLKDENEKLRRLANLEYALGRFAECQTDCDDCPISPECEESACLRQTLGLDDKEIILQMYERIYGRKEHR